MTESASTAASVAVLLLALLAGTTGCGEARGGGRDAEPAVDASPPGWRTHEDVRWGYSVDVPPGWHRAERSRSPTLADPMEILVVATYPVQHGDEGCGPLALRGFDADKVLVTIFERGQDPGSSWPDFPPRPANFRFEPGMSSEFTECVRTTRGIPLRDHWFRFTDGGRHFHVLVAIGEAAPPGAERDAYLILDSLRFDANVKPDWRLAG